jgi:hypothetical protein
MDLKLVGKEQCMEEPSRALQTRALMITRVVVLDMELERLEMSKIRAKELILARR